MCILLFLNCFGDWGDNNSLFEGISELMALKVQSASSPAPSDGLIDPLIVVSYPPLYLCVICDPYSSI